MDPPLIVSGNYGQEQSIMQVTLWTFLLLESSIESFLFLKLSFFLYQTATPLLQIAVCVVQCTFIVWQVSSTHHGH